MASSLSHLTEFPVLMDSADNQPLIVIGRLDNKGESHAICLEHDELTGQLSIGLIHGGVDVDAQSGRFRFSDILVSREEVIAMYRTMRATLHEMHEMPLTEIQGRVIDTCDAIVSEMIYCEAKLNPEPVQYLKRWYQSGVAFPALERVMDVVFDALAEHMQRNRCAQRIQQRFRCVVSDPCHPVCKRRLVREFNELTTA